MPRRMGLCHSNKRIPYPSVVTGGDHKMDRVLEWGRRKRKSWSHESHLQGEAAFKGGKKVRAQIVRVGSPEKGGSSQAEGRGNIHFSRVKFEPAGKPRRERGG